MTLVVAIPAGPTNRSADGFAHLVGFQAVCACYFIRFGIKEPPRSEVPEHKLQGMPAIGPYFHARICLKRPKGIRSWLLAGLESCRNSGPPRSGGRNRT